MDFIERMLGIAPDGGNGLTELALLVACVAAVVIVWRVRAHNRGNG